MVSSPSSCPPRSGSAHDLERLRQHHRPPQSALDPERSSQHGPASEVQQASLRVRSHARLRPCRPLAFLFSGKTLARLHSFSFSKLNSTLSRSCSAPFLHQAPPLALAFRLFSTKPRPFSTPALPSRTCGKLPEGRVFPPNRRCSHRRGILLFPLQGEIHRGAPFVWGRGAGAACFPSSKARPLATVCRGRTRWLLRRRGWWLL